MRLDSTVEKPVMFNNLHHLRSAKARTPLVQQPDAVISSDRVREWSGIEHTVFNHLIAQLSAPLAFSQAQSETSRRR